MQVYKKENEYENEIQKSKIIFKSDRINKTKKYREKYMETEALLRMYLTIRLIYNTTNLSKVLQKAVSETDNTLDNKLFKILDLILKEKEV